MTRHASARLAGLLYFATVPTAGFAYGYVAFLPKSDPAALLAALQAGRSVLPWTMVIGALAFVDYLVIAALFHRLLAPAGKVAADLMVLFVTASVPLALAALAERLDLIALLNAAPTQLPPDTLHLLQREAHLFQLASIFWGLWMMPLGWLSYRAGIVPRPVGLALIAGGVGYLSSFVLPVLNIELPPLATAAVMAVAMGSEFVFMFWLMIKGAGNAAHEAATTATV